MAIIGSLDKYATFNDTQFPTIYYNSKITQIGVAGIKNEEIELGFILPNPNFTIQSKGIQINQRLQEGLNIVKIQFEQEKTAQITIMRNGSEDRAI